MQSNYQAVWLGSSRQRIADFAGRATLVGLFGMLATIKVFGVITVWGRPHLDLLELATQVANLAFLVMVVSLAVVRLSPQRGSEGWEPWLSALAGTTLPLLFLALPPAEFGLAFRAFALGLIAIGGVLSVYVLVFLGRSFSIVAQARRLVTSGPYGLVRHPLYLAEEVAVIGVMLLYFSPAAVVIAAVHWLFQLRRMTNEEKVLRAAFPEYTSYAADTPKVLPRFS